MENFTPNQLRVRYKRSIQQRCYLGPFSSEEDALLIALHQKYGPSWRKMKYYFKRRSGQTITERYVNVLTPDAKVGPWSLPEDKLLIATIRKYGYGQWAKISKDLPGRTDHACLRRAKLLLKWSVDFHSERGTGEYDPGVYDPKLFAKILKPLPRTRYSDKIQEKKQKPERTNGLKTLLKGLEVIAPEYAAGIQDINSIDVSWMSFKMLHELSDVLQANLPQTEKRRECKYINKPPPIRKRAQSDSDHDDDICQPVEQEILQEEKDLVQSALIELLDMQADVMMEPKRMKAPNYSSRELAEMSLYTAYLSKHSYCKTLCNEEDRFDKSLQNDIEDEDGFDESIYIESLENVTIHFIQPPVYNEQPIILTPNRTTMTGMETLLATENRLLSMSKCASQSKSYVDFLCEREKVCPPCLQCLRRSSATSSVTPDSVISNMKKSSFLLDERLKAASFTESASVERLSSSCACKALGDSKRSVQLLRKRFLSLFTWPTLLSQVGFSDEQEEILRTEHNTFQDYFFNMASLPENCPYKRKKDTRHEKLAIKKLRTEELVPEIHPPVHF